MNSAVFSKQYNVSYITRLEKMTELIKNNAAIIEYNLPIRKLNENLYEECITIGILVLDSKLKFSILQMNAENPKSYLPGGSLWIEDFCGKMPIQFIPSFRKMNFFCTGAVLGFVGKKNDSNVFICSDVVFPKPVEPTNKKGSGSVLIVGSPRVGSENQKQLRIIFDYFSMRVDATVILGDISKDSLLDKFGGIFDGLSSSKENVQLFGRILIVPGPNDPTTLALPQHPFHSMLFDEEKYKLLKTLPHPAQELVCGKRIIFMNDMILEDLRRYVVDSKNSDIIYGKQITITETTDMDLLEQLLRMRYISPSSPDTLPCIPFFGEDPFVMKDFDYLVCTGFEHFEMRKIGESIIVGIPDFSEGGAAILADFTNNTFTEVTYC